MTSDLKSKIFLSVFVISAIVIGWSLWNYIRPQVIQAACQDMAQKSSNIVAKREIEPSIENDYEALFSTCLSDSGIYH